MYPFLLLITVYGWPNEFPFSRLIKLSNYFCHFLCVQPSVTQWIDDSSRQNYKDNKTKTPVVSFWNQLPHIEKLHEAIVFSTLVLIFEVCFLLIPKKYCDNILLMKLMSSLLHCGMLSSNWFLNVTWSRKGKNTYQGWWLRVVRCTFAKLTIYPWSLFSY